MQHLVQLQYDMTDYSRLLDLHTLATTNGDDEQKDASNPNGPAENLL